MGLDPTLGNKVAAAVINAFNSTDCKSGKPVVRDNGVKEWTVLAGLVSIDQNDKIEVLTLATGVKALPDEVRKYSNGWMVHDMHAEILALRTFNYLVLEDVLRERQDMDLRILEKKNGALRLQEGRNLALYISEPPCGDASMEYVARGQEAWEEPGTKKRKTEGDNGFHRGRASFDKVGVVRTKPGRGDSKVTLSKSCSDKLCLRQEMGILNSINSLLVEPIYLDYLVVAEEKHSQEGFDRCFGRIEVKHGRKLVPLLYTEDSYSFHKSDDAVPSPLSLVACPALNFVQVLSNGAKNGGFVKKKPPKPSGASSICNQRLAAQAKPLLPEDFSSYSEIKSSNAKRRQLKTSLTAVLGNWTPTSTDDFAL